jgi:hypothetical protein
LMAIVLTPDDVPAGQLVMHVGQLLRTTADKPGQRAARVSRETRKDPSISLTPLLDREKPRCIVEGGRRVCGPLLGSARPCWEARAHHNQMVRQRRFTMKRYKFVDISEAGLEDLVRQAPDLLEAGLIYIDHQRRAREGRLDLLLVDSGRALVVAELKTIEDDGMLWQALDYYDYVQDNLEGLARNYPNANIDPQQSPRLFLIAPSFSVLLLNRVKWLSISPLVSLFSYRCIAFDELEGGPISVYLEVKPPVIREAVTTSSLETHFEYITDSVSRAKAQDVLSSVQAIGPAVSIDPVKSGLSIKVSGKVFAYIWPKRRYFTVGYYSDTDDQWTNETVEADTDIEPVKARLRAAYTRKSSGS